MKGFAISPMTHGDLPEIIKADRLVLGHTLGEQTLANELDINPFAHYFVMREETTGKLAGHVSIWIDLKNAQILNLYVLPEFQHHGLGDDIMRFCIDYLSEYQVENITLEVRPSNFRARNLYGKFGFRQVAIRRNYYDNGEDALLYLKKCEVKVQ
ncbi:MAG TPA: ribosomal protein S18-alanine N-acetyltransferase [Bacillota bacterium]|nr:ribosomal protein S18-alanine N-acetyltransferase [Bacillota bacterium]HPF42060.1 ribosomal protein S18-alanine N-acetyltransferase [Bacillota bacterium]HPJ85782.1 ribosomal protein S18-alanine N-acetyltransferase [Bacillota bacterium]HPQ61507.1 ribosomal protein S18-alanine N-acetyltransferase [Bacillota bacterium]HRX91766.1 ribosomal protein S18-alanine N-acetyltransferase [Candidatus Izemoplasmatales bacterium]